MTEFLRTYDFQSEGFLGTQFTLWDLVIKTIKGEESKPYAIYQISNVDQKELLRHKILIASHKNTPGGYGLRKVAISIPDTPGVFLIHQKGGKNITIVNRNQTPLPEHRDSIHYKSVGLNEFFLFDPQALLGFLSEWEKQSDIEESKVALFPGD